MPRGSHELREVFRKQIESANVLTRNFLIALKTASQDPRSVRILLSN